MNPTHVILTALLMSFARTPVFANPVDAANSVRAQGCAGRPGVGVVLRHQPKLDQVAGRLARGNSLEDALTSAGYRTLASASFHARGAGADDALPQILSTRFCKQLTDAVFREIGTFRRRQEIWMVVATAFSARAPSDEAATGRRVLELVNQARSRGRRCGDRRYDAAPPLVHSKVLQEAARLHSHDMATKDFMSHRGSEGSTALERAQHGGHEWRVVGENLAAGQMTADEVVSGWLTSPGHCSNIMEPRFTQMGIAYAVEPKSEAGIYWTLVFGTP